MQSGSVHCAAGGGRQCWGGVGWGSWAPGRRLTSAHGNSCLRQQQRLQKKTYQEKAQAAAAGPAHQAAVAVRVEAHARLAHHARDAVLVAAAAAPGVVDLALQGWARGRSLWDVEAGVAGAVMMELGMQSSTHQRASTSSTLCRASQPARDSCGSGSHAAVRQRRLTSVSPAAHRVLQSEEERSSLSCTSSADNWE